MYNIGGNESIIKVLTNIEQVDKETSFQFCLAARFCVNELFYILTKGRLDLERALLQKYVLLRKI